LFGNIERFGSATALVLESGREVSYRQLVDQADQLAATIGPDRKLVAIECSNTEDVFHAYVGLVRARHAVILTAPGGAGDDTDLVRRFKPNLVFGLHGGDAPSFRTLNTDTIDLHPDLSVLLSTSGTTGSAKLVRLSDDNVAANAASIAEYLQLSAADRAITCLPLQYSYGLSVANSHLSVGASLLVTDRSIADPEFFELFDRLGATNFQGVPHSFQILARTAFLDQRRPGLRFFTQAGGKLDEASVTRFAEYAADNKAKFFVMYGQTEATARIAFVPPADLLANPGVIGQAIPQGTLAVELDGQPVPDGSEGELVYRGPNVMMGYAVAREELALGRVLTELKTGDLAKRLPSGYFKITGRASRFLKLFGLRIGLDDVEERLRDIGVTAAATGTDAKLIIALEGNGGAERIGAFVGEKFKLPKAVYTIVEVDVIPRNANGKVDYPAIRAIAAERAPAAGSSPLLSQASEILGKAEIDTSKSFIDLGGDSLSFVQFSMAIEETLGYLPPQWEQMPLADLVEPAPAQSAAPTQKQVHRTATDVVLRAIAIVGVCINHVFDENIEGSSIVLMALAGYSFARFQVPQLIARGIRATLVSLFSRVLVPYYVTIFALMAFFGLIYTPNLLLIYSMSPHHVVDALPPRLIYFWFIEVYIFATVLSSLLLTVPALGRLQQSRPVVIPCILFVGLETLRVIGTFNQGDGPDWSSINVFSSHGFVMVAPYFVLGWLLFVLNGWAIKLSVVLLATAAILVFPTFEFNEAWVFLLIALTALIFVPSVPTGRRVGSAISLVALSSYYIYLEHIFVMQAMGRLFEEPLRGLVGVIAVVMCLALGIFVQFGVSALASWYQRSRRAALARRRDVAAHGQSDIVA
jgi:non-ribosomal peptide synthetase component E (peptide arylation enzyme)/peptidoglycan/LPS O-acetylase OafA/YrhL